MKAIFSMSFSKKEICDKKTLEKQFKNSWYKCIKFLVDDEGIGIFNNNLKLVEVVDN